jgi:D-2-hydroxyacid dehydrogenase (NADP+)
MHERPVLLLGLELPAATEERLAQVRALAPEYDLRVALEPAQVERILERIEIAAGDFPLPLLPRARALRWFQQWGAGADWLLDHPEAVAMDFVLTNASGVHAVPISEHILALMLAFARQLHQALRAQMQGEWVEHTRHTRLFELEGKTLLLIGVGAIGARTARLAAALGMRVLGVRRRAGDPVPGVEQMARPERLPELLPQADFVVLTVPLTRETRGLIGERELRAMKREAIIINIGRGATIHESALVRALAEGWIAGAGLDVFEQEPLPPESPLWRMENVIITAHYAGLTPHYDERAFAIFLDNLRRYRAGLPLTNVVDKRLGY